MKTLCLFACGMAAVGLASCGYDDPYEYKAGAFQPYDPPPYGSHEYVSALTGRGSPGYGHRIYRYGNEERVISYGSIPSQRGSYHYIYHDTAQPLPAPGTTMKPKTWRYTTRWPSIWGSPVWVTDYKPKPLPRPANHTPYVLR